MKDIFKGLQVVRPSMIGLKQNVFIFTIYSLCDIYMTRQQKKIEINMKIHQKSDKVFGQVPKILKQNFLPFRKEVPKLYKTTKAPK